MQVSTCNTLLQGRLRNCDFYPSCGRPLAFRLKEAADSPWDWFRLTRRGGSRLGPGGRLQRGQRRHAKPRLAGQRLRDNLTQTSNKLIRLSLIQEKFRTVPLGFRFDHFEFGGGDNDDR